MTDDELDVLAAGVFGAVDDFSPEAVSALGHGLQLAESSAVLSRLGLSLFYLALDRERGEEASWLTMLVARSALRAGAVEGSFLERLAGAEDRLWAGLRDAIEVVAADRQHAHPSGIA